MPSVLRESVSQDLRKPLILRDFGIKRISNKELLKQSGTIKRDNTQIQSFIGDVPSGTTLKVNITGRVYYEFSDDWKPINVNSITKNIKTGDDIEDVLYRWLINYLNLNGIRDINTPKSVYRTYFKVNKEYIDIISCPPNEKDCNPIDAWVQRLYFPQTNN